MARCDEFQFNLTCSHYRFSCFNSPRCSDVADLLWISQIGWRRRRLASDDADWLATTQIGWRRRRLAGDDADWLATTQIGWRRRRLAGDDADWVMPIANMRQNHRLTKKVQYAMCGRQNLQCKNCIVDIRFAVW